ncbi:hypothetical protein NPIL_164921 [Nephila pilipes]|uniref:Uncharacterized protein n=1 Tax=Nephila pilipes TaxID=299642 RepID=A0A8X6NBE3_NEPPI|nr:hypothetical protein NPIL_164921 [Nephila pilipes]
MFDNIRRFKNRHWRNENFKPERKYLQTHLSKHFGRRTPRKCFICHCPNPFSHNSLENQEKVESQPERPSTSEVHTCSVIPQKGLHLRDITLGE